jgi:hypothetical protein
VIEDFAQMLEQGGAAAEEEIELEAAAEER